MKIWNLLTAIIASLQVSSSVLLFNNISDQSMSQVTF